MYNTTQKVQLCLFTISQKHKWSLKTPQHQQLIFKIKREKVFEYKIKISFPLQEIYHFPQILWYKGTSRKLRSSSEAGILEKNPHVKGLSHGTLAVFISKLHKYWLYSRVIYFFEHEKKIWGTFLWKDLSNTDSGPKT